GMLVSALAFGALLSRFSELRLIQVVQGAGLVTLILNCIALWKQEPRNPARTSSREPRPRFSDVWNSFIKVAQARRFLVAVALGTAAFSMQDILLEPYGGQVLHLNVGATTALTAIMAMGTLFAFALAARALTRGVDPSRLAAYGATLGLGAFAAVILAA